MFRTLIRIAIFLSVLTLNEQYSQLFFIGALALTPKKISTLFLLALGGVKTLVRPGRLPKNGKNLCILLFALAGIPSYGMSYLMGIPLRDVIIQGTSFYTIIFFYFMMSYMVVDERDLELAIWATIVGAALLGFTAVAGIGLVSEGHYTRSGGLGRNPNLAATYSVTGLTMGFLLFLEQRNRARQVLLLGLMGLTLIGILVSLSRTGFVCLLAVVGFLLVRSGRVDLLRWALPVMIVGGLAFFFLAPEQYFDRIATTADEAGDLATGNLANRRILGWWEGLKAFAASPIVGVGRESYRLWIAKNAPNVGEITPHNSYLHVLTSMGLVGFLPWMTALVLNFRDFSRVQRWARMFRARRDPTLNRLGVRAFFLQGAFVVWLVASLFSPFADDEGLWLLLALGTVVAHLGRERALVLAAEQEAAERASEPLYPYAAAAKTS